MKNFSRDSVQEPHDCSHFHKLILIFHYQATDSVSLENSPFSENKIGVRRQVLSGLCVSLYSRQLPGAFLQGGLASSNCQGYSGKALALEDLAEKTNPPPKTKKYATQHVLKQSDAQN